MNRDHEPCRECARFLATGGQKPDEEGPGLCEADGTPANSTGRPCVLFVKRGSWMHRKSLRSPEFKQ